MMRPKLYCDQDGVLADFSGPASRFFQVSFAGYVTLTQDDWRRYERAHPRMWQELPLVPFAVDLWNALRPYHPSILTAIPNNGSWDAVGDAKLEWMKHHFPKFGYHPEEQLHAVQRAEKQNYAKQSNGTPNILIDDLDKNIAEWQGAGGIGIHYIPSRESVENVRIELSKYF